MYLEIGAKVICVLMLIFQGGILDTYLVLENGLIWASWVVADIVVIVIWISTLYLAHRRFKMKRDRLDGVPPENLPDELPFAFIAWIGYVAFLAPRLVMLFGRYASKLDENNIFGPNFLKVAAACSPIIFLLLVSGHHDAEPHSERKHYIDRLTGIVALDLFDSMDLLEVSFQSDETRKFPDEIVYASLGFALVMLVLPTFALYELRVSKGNGQVSPLPFKVIYTASFVLLVNVPNLVIRSVLWHLYNSDVSVLLMKNVMCIVIGCMDIYDYIESGRPKKCKGCDKHFLRTHYGRHFERCSTKGATELDQIAVPADETSITA